MIKHCIALLFLLAGCAVLPASAPPELLVPQAAQMPDTELVSRGEIRIVSRHSGLVRKRSVGLHFGLTTDNFGKFHVSLGQQVYEGQLLASMNQRLLIEEAEELEIRINRTRRRNHFENELAALDIELLAMEYAQAFFAAAEALDEAAMEEAERLSFRAERMEMELTLARERQAFYLREDEERLHQIREQMRENELRAPFEGVITFIEDIEHNTWLPAFEVIIFISELGAETFIDTFGHMPTPASTVRLLAHYGGTAYELLPAPVQNIEARAYIAHGGPIPRRFITACGTQLPLGAYAAVHAYTLWVADTLRIPINALLSDPQLGYYVHKMQDGQPVIQTITVGVRTATFAEVLEGLEEGDEVIVRV